MPSIRRYGPALVTPQVSPRPELGRGREQTFAAFQDILGSANSFIRPAVEQVQTARGEQEALAAVDERGPQWGLRQLQGRGTSVTMGGQGDGLQPGPTRIRAAIARAGEAHGVDPGVLSVIASLESSFDPNAQNPSSSAGGLFQFIDGTAAQYGLENRFDVDQAADAGARFTRDNMSTLATALGRQPTVGEIYLAHQQGAQGAINLLTAPAPMLASAVVGREAVRLNGGNPDTMTARDFAALWIDKANERAGREGITVTVPGNPEYELETLNSSTFEPRMPFTVRDAAFNRAADRVITARAQSALEEGMRAAMQRADGDIGKLREEMESVRAQVMSELPQEMPGLATELQAQFDRGRIAAERQAIELSQRRVMARQEEALGQIVTTTRSEAERLALTGATAAELADHMAQATDTLAQFGPREGFEIAGRVYPADPTRAGTMSADAIASNMAEITMGARRMMIEADFMRSAAPGQYVDEFRRQVFSGNSPLPAGESLEMLRSMESRARSAESARRTAAEAERRRLEQGMRDTINAYVSMGEAGVPVAIPQEERARILAALSPFPDLQREAQMEFQVADAQVATHGMTGDQLMSYVERIRGDMADAAERGELDLGGAAIIESLQDRIKQVQDAVTAETIGLPLIEQLALNGGTADEVDYEGLRAQAAGNEEVLAAINEVEAFHRDVESLQGMSAAQREVVLEDARGALTVLAAQGQRYGAEALTTQRVIERLSEWSDHRRGMASDDPVRFARSVGVELPSFEGAETMDQVGAVIAERVNLLAPHTRPEGVDHPVPLTQAELDQISEVFQNSSRGQRAAFVGAVAEMGEDQAMAVFSRIGQSEPVIYAAGAVYTMGNQQAAGVILRGAVDTRLDGGSSTDLATAREVALGPLLEADMIAPEGIRDLDTTALAYARGLALAEGGRAIEANDLETGYQIALGQQADGTGGMAETRYGTTLLPPSWDRRRLNRAIGGITDEALTQFARGMVVDRQGRPFTADTLERTIEGLRPSPDDPYVLVPTDAEGNVFLTDDDNQRGVLTFDLREFE